MTEEPSLTTTRIPSLLRFLNQGRHCVVHCDVQALQGINEHGFPSCLDLVHVSPAPSLASVLGTAFFQSPHQQQGQRREVQEAELSRSSSPQQKDGEQRQELLLLLLLLKSLQHRYHIYVDIQVFTIVFVQTLFITIL